MAIGCNIVARIVEECFLWLYLASFFDKENSVKLCLKPIVNLGYIVISLLVGRQNQALQMILFSLICIVAMNIQFCIKMHDIVFHTCCLVGIVELCEIGSGSLINLVSFNEFTEKDYLLYKELLTALTSKVALLAILCILIQLRNTVPKEKTVNRDNLFIVVAPAIPLVIMHVLLVLNNPISLKYKNKHVAMAVAICSLISVMAILVVNYYRGVLQKKAYAREIQVQRELNKVEYYEMQARNDKNQRLLVHDIKNHLRIIDSLIETGEYGKTRDYIKNVMSIPALGKTYTVCDHMILNSLLCRYIQLSNETNVKLICDVRKKVIEGMEDVDITALIGNLLDNAFEAAYSCNEAFVEIFIKIHERTNNTVIIVNNSCEVNPFNKEGKLISTKKAIH